MVINGESGMNDKERKLLESYRELASESQAAMDLAMTAAVAAQEAAFKEAARKETQV